MGLAGALPVLLTALFLAPKPADASPSYAQSTGYNCSVCHSTSPPAGQYLTQFGVDYASCGYTLNCATPGANAPPPPPPNYGQQGGGQQSSQAFNPNNPSPLWFVQLRGATGQFADMVWTRRPGTFAYDALISMNGQTSTDVVTYQGMNGNGAVTFVTADGKTAFTGTVTSDGAHVFGGQYSGGTSPGDEWIATFWND